MDKTFSDMSDSVLPPFFDDITVKGRTFAEHKQNVKSVQSALSDLKCPPERLQSQCNYQSFIT